METRHDDDMLPEYDFSSMNNPIKGKYAERYRDAMETKQLTLPPDTKPTDPKPKVCAVCGKPAIASYVIVPGRGPFNVGEQRHMLCKYHGAQVTQHNTDVAAAKKAKQEARAGALKKKRGRK